MHRSTGVALLGRRYMPPRPDAGCVAMARLAASNYSSDLIRLDLDLEFTGDRIAARQLMSAGYQLRILQLIR